MRRILMFLLAVGLLAQPVREEAWKLYQQKQFREAAVLYERHLQEKPGDRRAGLLLGLAWQQANELARAEVIFARFEAPYFLARVQYLRGRFEEALANADLALARGESADRVYQLKGRIEEERGNLEAAVANYRKAGAAGQSGAASALYKLGRYEEAKKAAMAAGNEEGKQVLEKIARASVSAPAATVVDPSFSNEPLPFVLAHSPTPEKHLVSTMAGGLAIADFDGDGRADLFLANGADPRTLRKSRPEHRNTLLRNLGEAGFHDVTAKAGLEGEGFSIGTAVGDFDNDGDPDLFVAGAGRNLLYRNTGGRFEEIGKAAGIRSEPFSVAGAWLDFDGDGRLDLFVVNYLDWSPEKNKFCGDAAKGVRVYCHPREFGPLTNRLYRNRGDGTFEDVSEKSGIGAHRGKGMSVAVADLNDDGLPDLFVTNDTMPNFLFRNAGDGTFIEEGMEAGVALPESGQPVSAMGTHAGDVDQDGRVDLVFTALVRETFPFLRNTGGGRFLDVTYPSKLGAMSMTRSGWGAVLGDFNNDGWNDLLTANSHVTDNIASVSNEVYEESSTLFIQAGGVFQRALSVTGKGAWRGAVAADIDGDGRLDAVLTRLGGPAVLLRNRTQGAGRWVQLEMEAGVTAALVNGRRVEGGTACGYASACAAPVHVGLGERTKTTVQALRGKKAGKVQQVQAGQRVRVD